MPNNYDKKNIATMEMIYGEGYLSAGGDQEVTKILDGIDVSGKQVLDVGCGLGGATVTFARDHNAFVTGLDIDEGVLQRSAELVEKAGVTDRVRLTRFQPGPFPVEDNSFDIVYVTAVACHIPNLTEFFMDIHRVLKPAGKVIGRDWFKIHDNEEYRIWDDLLRDKGLNFYFVEPALFERALEKSGLGQITMTDRTESITTMAKDAMQRVDNELKQSLITVLGEEGYDECRRWTEIRASALSNNGIGQYQFRAEKS